MVMILLLDKFSGNPLNLWGMELGWTVIELQAAQQVGRPIDTQKYDGMQLKWQMDNYCDNRIWWHWCKCVGWCSRGNNLFRQYHNCQRWPWWECSC
ncbi:hypothetical protein C4A54_02829 [Escherichia coli]|nr:hypothetical protein C4A60_02828 [Escherichia coli]RDP19545.1 hypothetical protein C4A58_02810 [Escherichia coli]RDP28535.1 hypothetical protein C4A56_02786 [Escherichia coli]RDP38473.1 hypothetical protein C4A54_02829 [Escherichia coli]RDP44220.1 hypothetical protein C4A52_02867 [Escherichia coli]